MIISRPALFVALAAACGGGFLLATQGPSHAQAPDPAAHNARAVPIAEAMYLPARLPFGKPTTLEDVVAHLRKETKANVVLDLAALSRHQLTPASKVRLDLDEIRLRTGLKLLLDQLGLTTRIVPEDNLLIITDRSEADEPLTKLIDEVKELHRDLHAIQDEVREVRAILTAPAEEAEPAAKMRNPTIIEEVPADGAADKDKDKDKDDKADPKAKKEKSSTRTRPGA